MGRRKVKNTDVPIFFVCRLNIIRFYIDIVEARDYFVSICKEKRECSIGIKYIENEKLYSIDIVVYKDNIIKLSNEFLKLDTENEKIILYIDSLIETL